MHQTKEKAYKYAKEKVLDSLKWSGININNGLEIEEIIAYNEKDTSIVISTEGKGKAIKNEKAFINFFTEGLNYELNKKEKSIIELLNLSFSEYSKSAQFVTLISAFELFIEKKVKQEEKIVDLIDNELFKKLNECQNKYKISDKKLNDLKSRIGKIKNLSIKDNCKKIIKRYLDQNIKYNGKLAVDFFDDCYDIRSQIVHSKDKLNKLDNNIIQELRKLVKDVLSCKLNSKN
ncbi:hypothetical protein [Halanaerobium sp. ST460_2HS_T2]|uniref:hypothetical protein n=1 Tax=Halanaerobium sp. ST460_2HS_T2 TaxID=2183914 RepID=UPI000DF457A2|nr:hypothetical protein [Halanaerobium sp. ST460_2HS_T2]RCW49195.1 hypothetical protein DFR80_1641 [Halanaerobium sp. ST460_2HS_T2]